MPSAVAEPRTSFRVVWRLHGVDAGLDQVVAVRAFVTQFDRDYMAFNLTYAGYFPPGRLPAGRTIGVTVLARAASWRPT